MNRKSLNFFIVLTFLFLAGTILYLLTPAPQRDYHEDNNYKNPSAGNERSFRIAVSLSLTGDNADPAMMQKNAYKLWETEINKRGGLLGRKVEMVIIDDENDAEKAVQIYRSLIEERRVDLVFSPYSSPITKAIAPIVDRFGYPTLTPGASADSIWKQGYKNLFGMYIPASRFAEGILKLALLHHLKKVAILHADDEFSTTVAKGAKEWASLLGLDIVLCEEFKKGTKDLAPLAEKARDTGVELLVVGEHFTGAVDMRRAIKGINWYPQAFFATVGPALQKYKETLGPDAELSFSVSIWEPNENLSFPGSKEFVAAFKKHYKQEPSYHAATAYAAGQILELAIELAGSLERDRIRQALYELDTYSIIGRYAVDRTGMQIKRFPLTIQWQQGKKEIVWPEKVRTREPVFMKVN